ncbi:MAG: histidine--tRNA ligase [Anaerolineales bacterium]
MKNIIRPIKGTVDFYPENMALRTWLYNNIREVSESFGYREYEGPIIEPLALYAAKSGEELVKKQSFVFEDRGGNLVTLRPELTPTLARLVAQRQRQLAYPLRWWSYGPFWRYERPQRGRTREFFQWNIDLIGADSPEADAELAAVGAKLFQKLGLTPNEITIMVNNRRLVDSELEALGVSVEKRPEVTRLIDRRDKMSPENWEAYAGDTGLSSTQIEKLQAILGNDKLWQKSEELTRFFAAMDAMGLRDYTRFNPSIIRGLDYYTGTVFEAWDCDGEFRAIFGGGRYDNLVADVGGDSLPGVGFAMGDKVIAVVMEKFNCLPNSADLFPSPILVTVFDEATLGASFSLAAELREAGFKVAIYPEPAKLGKQFKYANRIGARVAVVLGPDEIANGQAAIKDLRTRTQGTHPRAEAADVIRKMLDRGSAS